MSTDSQYSDEKLQMFIDDEMNRNDRAEMMEAISKDEQLSIRVCELIQLKDAVRLAYSEPPGSHRQSPHQAITHNPNWLNAVAAVLLLAIGTLAGWLLHPQLVASNGAELVATSQQQQAEKIILHISQSNPRHFAAALDYAEKFLADHKGGNDEIDVVAHAGGLDLMRADASPLKEKIISLMNKHDNIHFIACAGAIKMFKKNTGALPNIIQGVSTDSTAFDHIVGRLQHGGWRYVKVETVLDI